MSEKTDMILELTVSDKKAEIEKLILKNAEAFNRVAGNGNASTESLIKSGAVVIHGNEENEMIETKIIADFRGALGKAKKVKGKDGKLILSEFQGAGGEGLLQKGVGFFYYALTALRLDSQYVKAAHIRGMIVEYQAQSGNEFSKSEAGVQMAFPVWRQVVGRRNPVEVRQALIMRDESANKWLKTFSGFASGIKYADIRDIAEKAGQAEAHNAESVKMELASLDPNAENNAGRIKTLEKQRDKLAGKVESVKAGNGEEATTESK